MRREKFITKIDSNCKLTVPHCVMQCTPFYVHTVRHYHRYNGRGKREVYDKECKLLLNAFQFVGVTRRNRIAHDPQEYSNLI